MTSRSDSGYAPAAVTMLKRRHWEHRRCSAARMDYSNVIQMYFYAVVLF